MSVTETSRHALLQLKTQQQAQGEVDATIPIRWCVQSDLIKELKQKGYVDPHLLLVVRYSESRSVSDGITYVTWHDTARYLVRLTNEMQYVSFKRPGANQVTAAIVDVSKGAPRTKLEMGFYAAVLDKSNGRYEYDITHGDGSFRSEIRGAPVLDVTSTLDVEVPREMFAPEPSEWIKTIVGRFFTSRPYDQCHFRRRTIASLIWLPFFVVLGTIFKALSLIAALVWGLRKPAVGHLFKPLHGRCLGVWEDSDKTSIWFHKKEHQYDRVQTQDFPWFLLNPFTFTVPPALLYAIFQINVTRGKGELEHVENVANWGWWKTFFVVNGVLIGAFAAIVIVGFLLIVGIRLINRIQNDPEASKHRQEKATDKKREKEAIRVRRNATRQEVILRELESMVCGSTPTSEADLHALRKDKQTVSLRFSDLKSRVCRPFAG